MSSLFDWSPRPQQSSSPPMASTAPLLAQEQRVKQEQGEEEQRDNLDNFSDVNDGVVVSNAADAPSGTSVGAVVGASNNNDSRDQAHESHESLHQEVQQTKEKRENPCFIKDGGPKGTFRELRVWQVTLLTRLSLTAL
jgi:hypothetical protein